MAKIYTKLGDSGETSLYDGRRISKASLIIETLGCLDELNAYLGILSQGLQEPFIGLINNKQEDLMRIAAMIATHEGRVHPKSDYSIKSQSVEKMEKEIDSWQIKLPELKHFILPGGSQSSARAHFARTICRRLECQVVKLHEKERVPLIVLKYINRFGDWLFVLARYLNDGKDKVWLIN